MNIRKTTSLTMLISFILLVLTSIILYIVPHGRVAYWSDWRMWGLTKSDWGNIHINLGFLFLLAGLLHLFYNWKPMIAYMKNKSKQLTIFTADFNIALILTLIITIGTLLNIPPMSTVINFGESIKETAAKKYGEPPYGHAELSSLKLFAKKTDLDLQAAKQLLLDAGIQGVEDKVTLGALAELNQTTPKALFNLMKSSEIKDEHAVVFPDSPPAGFGNKTLAEICSTYELNIPTMVSRLVESGIKAAPEQTFKQISGANGTDPHALFEILHGLAIQE